LRTIRLFNKGIGKGQKLAWVPTVSPLLENDQGNDPLGGPAGCPNAAQPVLVTVSTSFLRPGGSDSKHGLQA
jgi:hypothetical protein